MVRMTISQITLWPYDQIAHTLPRPTCSAVSSIHLSGGTSGTSG
jgi:hypothetical protein